MRIMIFTGGFFPGKTFGGPPVSVDNFCSLMREHECFIVTSDHDNGTTERYEGINDGWNERENAKVLYLPDREYFSLRKLDEVVKEIDPDWIYLQSLFQDLAFLGLIIAKINHSKVMLAPRGELCAGAFKKKYKKIPYIFGIRFLGLLRNVDFQSTSDEETEAIQKYLKVDPERIHYLTNAPSIPKEEYLHDAKKKGVGKFIFLSRIHPKKNLKYALTCMKKMKGKVVFDIYGPLEDKLYWEECCKLIEDLPRNVKVNYCGLVTHEGVHEVFSNYDAFIFPTFSENYGHVIAESLLSGCTIIISDQTPWTNINEYGAGWAFPLADPTLFIKALNNIVDADEDEMSLIRSNIKKYLDYTLRLKEIKDNYNKAFNIDN